MCPDTDSMQSVDFDKQVSLESPPANEAPSRICACEHKNIEYFIGFIDSCNVDATLMISYKILTVFKNLTAGRR